MTVSKHVAYWSCSHTLDHVILETKTHRITKNQYFNFIMLYTVFNKITLTFLIKMKHVVSRRD